MKNKLGIKVKEINYRRILSNDINNNIIKRNFMLDGKSNATEYIRASNNITDFNLFKFNGFVLLKLWK